MPADITPVAKITVVIPPSLHWTLRTARTDSNMHVSLIIININETRMMFTQREFFPPVDPTRIADFCIVLLLFPISNYKLLKVT